MIKVFVIDDSLTVRNGFKKILSEVDDIVLLGEAANPVDALSVFSEVGLPDLFILDIEMPKMDGLTFLKRINAQRPTPVIICSSLVTEGSESLIDALRLGAIDIIEKPKSKQSEMFILYKDKLLNKIRCAAYANIDNKNSITDEKKRVHKKVNSSYPASHSIIGIGSSTGGVQVLEEIVKHLNPSHQAIIVVQHIPKSFSSSLAKRLNEMAIYSNVKEAEDGDLITENSIYIAPGGIHIEVEQRALKYYIKFNDAPKVNSHKPSVNVLFNSLAKVLKADAKGFILTGMGDDGAEGLKNMLEAGAQTYVQNRQTSTIYGMPKVAFELGAAQKSLSIYEIIQAINE